MLEVQGLSKRYGDVWAVREMTVSLAGGGCLILLGQNGAGKTTAMRCMSGVVRPTAGSVLVDGVDAVADPDGARARIGMVPETPGLYERMSSRAYLDYFAQVYGLDQTTRSRRIGDLLELFDLAAAGDRWLGTFSKGMRQKVALIRATLHEPRLVLADEPTSALDPDSARVAWDYLLDLRAKGSALVVCTHDMEEATTLAGRDGTIGVLSDGRLLAIGDFGELTAAAGLHPHQQVVEKPTLEEIYLAIVAGVRESEARLA